MKTLKSWPTFCRGGALLAFYFFHVTIFAQSNNLVCGTPDVPISTLIQQKQNFSSNVSVSGILVPRIPVWVYVLQNNGVSNNPLAEAEVAIAGANQFFENIFEFTICGSTMVNNSPYYDLYEADISSMLSLGISLSPPEADNCLKVFICNSIQLTTNSATPSGLTIDPTSPGHNFQSSLVIFTKPTASLAAHEFGHFFHILFKADILSRL
jgi:hypothetical protein